MLHEALVLPQVTSIERGTISQKDLDEALGGSHATPEVLCAPALPMASPYRSYGVPQSSQGSLQWESGLHQAPCLCRQEPACIGVPLLLTKSCMPAQTAQGEVRPCLQVQAGRLCAREGGGLQRALPQAPPAHAWCAPSSLHTI